MSNSVNIGLALGFALLAWTLWPESFSKVLKRHHDRLRAQDQNWQQRNDQ